MIPFRVWMQAGGALAVLVACGDRPVTDDTSPSPTPHDLGAAAESGDASEGEVICQEGLLACNGECIDPSSDDEHCGACDHACKQAFRFGHCLEGSCASAFLCGGVEQELVTCVDVCALHGQVCDDGPSMPRGCGGAGYQLYFDHDAHDDCELGFAGETSIEASCTTPIDWSIAGGWEGDTARAVACCCTQDPQS